MKLVLKMTPESHLSPTSEEYTKKHEASSNIDFAKLEEEFNNESLELDEIASMKDDIDMAQYHERVISGKLTDEEIEINKNIDKLLNLPIDALNDANFEL